ncbi:MAG: hypothetical protein MJZ28_12465, partial [Paludibacteraceae bacterium]|nr:hypothetical protein [Paludibacteraceae bacterium]
MNKLSKFISWNEALLDYFVRNGSTVWYVTDSVIEHIGQKYGIVKEEDVTFCDDFKKNILFVKCGGKISSDLFFRERISPTSSTLQVIEKESIGVKIPKREDVQTLTDFALFLAGNKFYYLTQDSISKKYDTNNKSFLGDYLYLSYIIFILLGYNQYGNQQWSGVKELFCFFFLQFRESSCTGASRFASLFVRAINVGLLNNHCT